MLVPGKRGDKGVGEKLGKAFGKNNGAIVLALAFARQNQVDNLVGQRIDVEARL